MKPDSSESNPREFGRIRILLLPQVTSLLAVQATHSTTEWVMPSPGRPGGWTGVLGALGLVVISFDFIGGLKWREYRVEISKCRSLSTPSREQCQGRMRSNTKEGTMSILAVQLSNFRQLCGSSMTCLRARALFSFRRHRSIING